MPINWLWPNDSFKTIIPSKVVNNILDILITPYELTDNLLIALNDSTNEIKSTNDFKAINNK